MESWKEAYRVSAADLVSRGFDVEGIKKDLKAQRIETPSWGYADSGTRFKVFQQAGAARTTYEKLADAAQVHKFTGVAPSVALHIPWDKVDDYAELSAYAASLGLKLGAINPNLFQEDEYMLGSLCNPDPCCAPDRPWTTAWSASRSPRPWARATSACGWPTAPATPARTTFAPRKHRLVETLAEVYAAMPAPMRLLIEYKFFEPAFYSTDLGDWGTSLLVCQKLGERAQVLVDLGHHRVGHQHRADRRLPH